MNGQSHSAVQFRIEREGARVTCGRREANHARALVQALYRAYPIELLQLDN